MTSPTIKQTQCVQYELEIQIAAPPERVWGAIIDETNCWWLPDFHMTGEGSIVAFDLAPGGKGLHEVHPDGGFLVWCHVHYLLPRQHTIYLFGHMAPDWGGPSSSSLKLAVEPRGDGSVLKVVDAHFGNVTEASIESLSNGWTQLFSDGLKEFVENGTRQDQ